MMNSSSLLKHVLLSQVSPCTQTYKLTVGFLFEFDLTIPDGFAANELHWALLPEGTTVAGTRYTALYRESKEPF